MKLDFCLSLWYVDIIDHCCGMLERDDLARMRVYVGRLGDTRKTNVFLHIATQTDLTNDWSRSDAK